MIPVYVAGDLRIVLDDLSERDIGALEQAARVVVRTREKRDGVLGWVATDRDLAHVDGEELVLPRGMATMVRRLLPAASWHDETVHAPHAFELGIELRAAQREIAEIVTRRAQGLILAATGAGKTLAALAAIVAIAQRSLILVPTVALADQWRREVARALGVDAAICAGGTWKDAPIVIATPETARRHLQRLGAFGAVFVDEVQGFATELRTELLAAIPARYRIGLTATLPRDHRGAVLERVIGPVLHRVPVARGIAEGHLVAPRYVQVPTSFRAPYGGPDDWPELLEELASSIGRNATIVETIEAAVGPTLVLSSRLAHLATLHALLVARGSRAAILSGETPARTRTEILDRARRGDLDVLLGSVVADEGIDLPGLGSLVLAWPSRAEPRLLQRIGRVIRASAGKRTPVVYDLVDDVGPLRRQAEIRAEAFARAFGAGVAA